MAHVGIAVERSRYTAKDMFALLDRLGVQRVKAIGLSMGAKTLLHMATEQPGRMTRWCW